MYSVFKSTCFPGKLWFNPGEIATEMISTCTFFCQIHKFPDMTYNVFGGTLNPAQSNPQINISTRRYQSTISSADAEGPCYKPQIRNIALEKV